MTTISMHRLKDGVLTSADLAELTITNSAGSHILLLAPISPTSPGVYAYSDPTLIAGAYTATWVFTTAGLPTDTISRAFVVDSAQEITEGLTLMQLERLVARRVGPYRLLRVGMSSSVNSVVVPRLMSSLALGAYEDQFLLRRGLTSGDELILNFSSTDRVRQVATYDPTLGTLVPDLAYTMAPVGNEAVEIHALDPENELRPAVLDGLRRCFFWDTLAIAVTGSGVYNIDLTASAPWLTNPAWIKNVSLSYPSQLLPPTRLNWWEPYRQGKRIKLYTKGGAVGSVTLSVLRPAFSLVNGEQSLSGPNDDLDVIYVDGDYAAWAGVLEAWKTIPEVLTPMAAQAFRPSRDDAANEFTKKGREIANQVVDRRQVDYGYPDIVQIGNLAEPVT